MNRSPSSRPYRLGARHRRRAAGVLATVVLLAPLGACGSQDEKKSGPPADVAAAEAAIKDYIDAPTPFPIDTPLVTMPTGKRIAFMDCGSAICGVFAALAEPAAEQLGMEFTAIKAGLSADSVRAAFDTVVQAGYDGVFVPAIQPSLWDRGLDQLEEAGIPVVTAGVVGIDKDKVDMSQVSDAMIDRTAKLLASYVVAEQGDDADVVFYVTPEIAFNPVLEKAFTAEIERLCPRCSTRTTKVPAAALGSQAPTIISDDLQANPDTTAAVFAQSEQTAGLPQALKTAGISDDLLTMGVFPDPATLQLIQSGQVDVGLGFDAPVVAWTEMDSLARLTTGEPVAPGAAADTPPQQFLTKDVLTGDISRGWVAYPDFPERFAELWAQAS
jgi:ribose transport system substrate-binding protein